MLTANTPAPGNSGKPLLLAVGYWVPATGFTRVLEAILTRLSTDYEVHVIGIAYKGPVQGGAITIYPCNLSGGDVFGVFAARDFVDRHHPAIIFLLNDIWILSKYLRWLAPYQDRSSIVCYCPLDGKLVGGDLLAPFAALAPGSMLVLYSEFAREEMRRAAAILEASDPSLSFPAFAVIPHGVDTAAFYPLSAEERAAARRQIFPATVDLADGFFVLNANRAQPRKRIDLTLQGFALFARDKPANAQLVLHHAVLYGDEKEVVMRQMAELGLAERVIFSPDDDRRPADAELNLIYNACDVGVNSAMGEGWGLVSFEHAACGRAQIVPRHSACAELWHGAAALLDPISSYVPDFALFEMQEIAPQALAAALQRLYADRSYLAALANAAYRNATQPRYGWDNVADRWRLLFDELIAARRDSYLPSRD